MTTWFVFRHIVRLVMWEESFESRKAIRLRRSTDEKNKKKEVTEETLATGRSNYTKESSQRIFGTRAPSKVTFAPAIESGKSV